MRTDAAEDTSDRLRDAVEQRARRELGSHPDSPIGDAWRASLLAEFSEAIRRARPGADHRLRAAEGYSGFVGLAPRVAGDGGLLLVGDGGAGRKSAGAYYTPKPLVDLVLQSTLDPLIDQAAASSPASACENALLALRVCDPACGVGHFLAHAARRIAERLALVRSGDRKPASAAVRAALKDVTETCIYGGDIDPTAAAICRMVLLADAGLDPASGALGTRIACADSLLAPPPDGAPFHAIIGNPPFVNAIEGGTDARTRSRLRERYPELGPLADLSHYFLALAARAVAPGGRIGLVLPRSILGSENAAALRAGMPPRLRPTLLYAPDAGRLFNGADVFVCVVALGPDEGCRVGLGSGAGRTRWRSTIIRDDNWWRAMHREGDAAAEPHRARIGDEFEVRSNMFINDAYLLRRYLVSSRAGAGPKLVTTGLIEPGECLWGRAPCRYLGRDYAFPRVRARAALPPSLSRRRAAAARPKVLVAGLAGRLECFVDERGEYMGSVGTYAIFDREDRVPRLREVALQLLSERATALLRSTLGANALTGGNIGIRAGFLRDFPLPAGTAASPTA